SSTPRPPPRSTLFPYTTLFRSHLLLALIDTANRALKEVFRTYNVSRERVLQALTNVRGNQRVTSDNPEETYNALKKYGTDLVERSEEHTSELQSRFDLVCRLLL